MKTLVVLLALLATLSFSFSKTAAQTIVLDPVVVTGLSSPVYLTHARDGTNRLYIVEQGGIIKVLQPGASTPTIFLNITTKVLSGGERGLLGLAFHPQYETNRRFFVYYTRQPDGVNVVAEYRASASNPNVADTTELLILAVAQPFANHNGGMIEFGPDGFLYIAKGDGGSGNDPGNRAQNVDELLGKLLRIDINTPPYASPPGNPFAGSIPGRDEIWAYGLRNPFRFSFDRLTGDLYIGDVGQNTREEVDFQSAASAGGLNYGWRIWEGTGCTGNDPTLCNPAGFTFPITEYTHNAGRCSITGGYVYRGARASLPLGSYVFADFCTGEIFLFNGGSQSLLLDTSRNISSFGEDEAGELYVVGLGGTVERIRNPSAPTPVAAGQMLISEFRLRGPAGAGDEFIEIYNNTDAQLNVTPVDGSAGFAVVASDGLTRCIIPSGTLIPSRGHFLCVNSSGYSLATHPAGVGTTATGDATYTNDIPDNMGIALFNTANPINFVIANRLDASGSTSESNTLFKEDSGYAALTATVSTDHSFRRDDCGKQGSMTIFGACPTGGMYVDGNSNGVDFYFVDTNGTSTAAGQRIGSPGPENLSSPILRNSGASVGLLDSCAGSADPPNRIRNFTSDPSNNSTFGTLEIRRTITNNTGGPIVRLRIRVIDITTFPPGSGFADLRVRSSSNVSLTVDRPPCGSGTSTATVNGTTLDQPPTQVNGGGFGSTLSVSTVTLATPLANGASIDLRFLLGIQQTGAFKFFVSFEALP
jgi:hypothetical protein